METRSKSSEIVATPPGVRRAIKLGVIVFFAAVVAIMLNNLPRGFSDDLSVIGQGTPAMVLLRDKNAVSSIQQVDVMDDLSGRYKHRVNFLLTDYDTPAGEAFMQTHRVSPSHLVVFDGTGSMVKVLPLLSSDSLAQELDTLFPAEN